MTGAEGTTPVGAWVVAPLKGFVSGWSGDPGGWLGFGVCVGLSGVWGLGGVRGVLLMGVWGWVRVGVGAKVRLRVGEWGDLGRVPQE